MCYKQQMQNRIFHNIDKKLESYPDFIKEFFNLKKSAKTANCQFGFVSDLLNWLLTNKHIEIISSEELDKVTSNHIIKYLKHLQTGENCRANSLESIGTKKAVFCGLWEYMYQHDIVRKNVIRLIPSNLFKAEKTSHEIKIPTEEQIQAFISSIEASHFSEDYIIRNLAIVYLIMGSGIRSEELIGLDIGDIFLDEDFPYISVLGKGHQQEKTSVKISESAAYHLRKYIDRRDGINPYNDNALFLSNRGTRLSKSAIDNIFNSCSNGKISPHQLRHWVGTELYAKTLDIKLVQTQLRHKNLETAAKYYVRLDDNKLTQAVWEL